MKEERIDGIFYFPRAREGLIFAGLWMVVSYTGRFLGYGDISGVAGAFVGATTLCIRLFWPLRCKAWFWMTIAALSFAQMIVIVHFPFDSAEFRGRTYAFFALLDIVVIVGTVVLLNQLISIFEVNRNR